MLRELRQERRHAVVIGASIAGLATARVLAERFARVTVLERHANPNANPTATGAPRDGGTNRNPTATGAPRDGGTNRNPTATGAPREGGDRTPGSLGDRAPVSIAPQGRYPHVLLDGGGLAAERLFPSFKDDAIAAGAPLVDRDTVRWWSDGWRVKRRRDDRTRVLASRALIETLLRSYVEAIPNVRIDYGVTPVGLVMEGDGDRDGARIGADRDGASSGGDRDGARSGNQRDRARSDGDRDGARIGADRDGASRGGDRDGAPSRGDRVIGVRLGALYAASTKDNRGTSTKDHHGSILDADLVVDCSGRGSRLVPWLEAAGFPAPPVTELDIDLGYLVLTLRRRPADLGGATAMIVQNIAPEMTRLGLALAIEGDRWMVMLGGYFGDLPPMDRTGYLAFADSLPVPELAQLLRAAMPIAEPLPYRFRSSRRIHVERAARWPIGLVALGDATCSFNPLYGQGMSVALMQAEHLGKALDDCGTAKQLGLTIQRELAAITDLAWNIAAGGDLAYPQVVGERKAISGLVRRYMAKVFRACSVDAEVVDTLFEVTNLVAPPTRLLRPSMIARVLRAQRRWPGRGATASAGKTLVATPARTA